MLTFAIMFICAISILITILLWHLSYEMLLNSTSEAMGYAAERLDSIIDTATSTTTLMAEDQVLLNYVQDPLRVLNLIKQAK